MIIVKSNKEIELMRTACRVTGQTLKLMEESIRPGITTLELDKLAEKFIRDNGCIPSFKNYSGFPKSICASVNEQVIHGIPSNNVVLKANVFRIYHLQSRLELKAKATEL